MLDLGTGLRFWGLDSVPVPFRATALVSHLHWDHVQGLPFFTPLHAADAQMHVIGPPQEGVSLDEAFTTFLCPPYFPVTLDQHAGPNTFEECQPGPMRIGHASVTTASVPHVGPTVGYRIECDGATLAYVSDHQQPGAGATTVDPAILDLCRGVDLLIHDAQYTDAEFADRSDWGHCTTEYALEVAMQAGVTTLALFHHDPLHDDETVDRLTSELSAASIERNGPKVIAAFEGLIIDL